MVLRKKFRYKVKKNQKNVDYYDGRFPRAILENLRHRCEMMKFSDLEPCETYKEGTLLVKIMLSHPITKRFGVFLKKFIVCDVLRDESVDNSVCKTVVLYLFSKKESCFACLEQEGFILLRNFFTEGLFLNSKPRGYENIMTIQVWGDQISDILYLNKELHILRPGFYDMSLRSLHIKSKCTNPVNAAKSESKPRKKPRKRKTAPDRLSTRAKYTLLNVLTETLTEEVFNIYGSVISVHREFNRGTFVISLNLILTDETDTAFKCVVSGASMEICTSIRFNDVVRIHNLEVIKLDEELKGVCNNPEDFLLFRKGKNELVPKTSSTSYKLTPEDKNRVSLLFMQGTERLYLKRIIEQMLNEYANDPVFDGDTTAFKINPDDLLTPIPSSSNSKKRKKRKKKKKQCSSSPFSDLSPQVEPMGPHIAPMGPDVAPMGPLPPVLLESLAQYHGVQPLLVPTLKKSSQITSPSLKPPVVKESLSQYFEVESSIVPILKNTGQITSLQAKPLVAKKSPAICHEINPTFVPTSKKASHDKSEQMDPLVLDSVPENPEEKPLHGAKRRMSSKKRNQLVKWLKQANLNDSISKAHPYIKKTDNYHVRKRDASTQTNPIIIKKSLAQNLEAKPFHFPTSNMNSQNAHEQKNPLFVKESQAQNLEFKPFQFPTPNKDNQRQVHIQDVKAQTKPLDVMVSLAQTQAVKPLLVAARKISQKQMHIQDASAQSTPFVSKEFLAKNPEVKSFYFITPNMNSQNASEKTNPVVVKEFLIPVLEPVNKQDTIAQTEELLVKESLDKNVGFKALQLPTPNKDNKEQVNKQDTIAQTESLAKESLAKNLEFKPLQLPTSNKDSQKYAQFQDATAQKVCIVESINKNWNVKPFYFPTANMNKNASELVKEFFAQYQEIKPFHFSAPNKDSQKYVQFQDANARNVCIMESINKKWNDASELLKEYFAQCQELPFNFSAPNKDSRKQGNKQDTIAQIQPLVKESLAKNLEFKPLQFPTPNKDSQKQVHIPDASAQIKPLVMKESLAHTPAVQPVLVSTLQVQDTIAQSEPLGKESLAKIPLLKSEHNGTPNKKQVDKQDENAQIKPLLVKESLPKNPEVKPLHVDTPNKSNQKQVDKQDASAQIKPLLIKESLPKNPEVKPLNIGTPNKRKQKQLHKPDASAQTKPLVKESLAPTPAVEPVHVSTLKSNQIQVQDPIAQAEPLGKESLAKNSLLKSEHDATPNKKQVHKQDASAQIKPLLVKESLPKNPEVPSLNVGTLDKRKQKQAHKQDASAQTKPLLVKEPVPKNPEVKPLLVATPNKRKQKQLHKQDVSAQTKPFLKESLAQNSEVKQLHVAAPDRNCQKFMQPVDTKKSVDQPSVKPKTPIAATNKKKKAPNVPIDIHSDINGAAAADPDASTENLINEFFCLDEKSNVFDMLINQHRLNDTSKVNELYNDFKLDDLEGDMGTDYDYRDIFLPRPHQKSARRKKYTSEDYANLGISRIESNVLKELAKQQKKN